MSAEMTPAVERAAQAMHDADPRGWAYLATQGLAAALDAEEMARAMCPHSHCDGTKRSCPDHSVNVERANTLRTALLGADS